MIVHTREVRCPYCGIWTEIRLMSENIAIGNVDIAIGNVEYCPICGKFIPNVVSHKQDTKEKIIKLLEEL